MSVTRFVATGSLLGVAGAAAVYVTLVSSGPTVTSAPLSPPTSPVVRATVARPAPCPPPAVVRGSECVLTTPGRTVTLPPTGGEPSSTGRPRPTTTDPGGPTRTPTTTLPPAPSPTVRPTATHRDDTDHDDRGDDRGRDDSGRDDGHDDGSHDSEQSGSDS